MSLYTRLGDDGTTGLLYGSRVAKNSPQPSAVGAADEAQAALGLARASSDDAEMTELLVELMRALYVAMADLCLHPNHRGRGVAGETLVTGDMLSRIESLVDHYSDQIAPIRDFVIPGGTETSARLDLARTLVRRAEREAVAAAGPGSLVVPFLNRLADLVWVLARRSEGGAPILAKPIGTKSHGPSVE